MHPDVSPGYLFAALEYVGQTASIPHISKVARLHRMHYAGASVVGGCICESYLIRELGASVQQLRKQHLGNVRFSGEISVLFSEIFVPLLFDRRDYLPRFFTHFKARYFDIIKRNNSRKIVFLHNQL